jgi:hypothetical protein
MILGIEDPVMEGNAPADADGRTLAPRLELRREVDKPVVVTRDPRGTARGTAMDRTAGDIPEKCPTKVAISSRAEISKLKIPRTFCNRPQLLS